MKMGDKFRCGSATGTIVEVGAEMFEVAWDNEVFTSKRFTKHAEEVVPGWWEETRKPFAFGLSTETVKMMKLYTKYVACAEWVDECPF